jgi:hypothetical protein
MGLTNSMKPASNHIMRCLGIRKMKSRSFEVATSLGRGAASVASLIRYAISLSRSGPSATIVPSSGALGIISYSGRACH